MKSTTMHRVVALAATAVTLSAACGGDASSAEKSGGEATPLTLRLGTVEERRRPVRPLRRRVRPLGGGDLRRIDRRRGGLGGGAVESRVRADAGDDGERRRDRPRAGPNPGVGRTRRHQPAGAAGTVPRRQPRAAQRDRRQRAGRRDVRRPRHARSRGIGAVARFAAPPARLRTTAAHRGGLRRRPAAGTDLGRLVPTRPRDRCRTGRRGPRRRRPCRHRRCRDGAQPGTDLPALGTFTANITFYPKVNALVANAEVLDSLSDDQRDVLRQAATDTTAYAVDTNPTEHDLAEQYCADGGSVALADAADLAELAELAAPVLAELEADDTTRRIIGEIRELKSTVAADPATAAAACGPVVEEASDATGSESGADVPPEEVSELPDGVYRVEISLDDVEAAGLSNADGPTGIWTLEIDDGTWVQSCVPLDLPGTDCGNTPSRWHPRGRTTSVAPETRSGSCMTTRCSASCKAASCRPPVSWGTVSPGLTSTWTGRSTGTR